MAFDKPTTRYSTLRNEAEYVDRLGIGKFPLTPGTNKIVLEETSPATIKTFGDGFGFIYGGFRCIIATSFFNEIYFNFPADVVPKHEEIDYTAVKFDSTANNYTHVSIRLTARQNNNTPQCISLGNLDVGDKIFFPMLMYVIRGI